MLKVNVGLSRKLSRDYNSTGFSVNLDGEVCVPLDDPEGIVEKVKELFDLAEDALQQQIDRYEGDSAIASRDEEPAPARPVRPTERRHLSGAQHEVQRSQPPTRTSDQRSNGSTNGTAGDVATNKQIQFLLTLGKRNGLTPPQLEGRIAEILGRSVGLYDLSKAEAGQVLDALAEPRESSTNGNGRTRMARR